MNNTQSSNKKKSAWVTPELSQMSIEQTLSGLLPNPSETMADFNSSESVPGGLES